jgi:transposase-like protein
LQPQAKEQLHQIWMAATRAEAIKAFDLFIETYRAKYPAAVECLNKDRDVLLTFYDFPAEHWPNRGRPTRSNRPSPPCGFDTTRPRATDLAAELLSRHRDD